MHRDRACRDTDIERTDGARRSPDGDVVITHRARCRNCGWDSNLRNAPFSEEVIERRITNHIADSARERPYVPSRRPRPRLARRPPFQKGPR